MNLTSLARKFLPPNLRRWLRVNVISPPDWGGFDRLQPYSPRFGFDRGLPIDRFYIEHFLNRNRNDIRGQVLEVAERTYTTRFGDNRVSSSHILHVQPQADPTVIVGNLENGQGIPSSAYDCLVLTQVIQSIYDMKAAVNQIHRALKPRGTALVTISGISQISRYDMERWGDFWRCTSLSASRLFGDVFGPSAVTVETYGNVKTATAFLHGLAVEELRPADFEYQDPAYQLLISVRAVKPPA